MLHRITKVSEDVNRKCPPRNTTVQLSTPYTDPERHNIQRYGQTDGQTTVSCQAPIILNACRMNDWLMY